MPQLPHERHLGRAHGVVLGEFELGGEDTAFVGGALGTLDEGFPKEEVFFGDGTGGDAFDAALGEGAVFFEEPLCGHGGAGHGGCGGDVEGGKGGWGSGMRRGKLIHGWCSLDGGRIEMV